MLHPEDRLLKPSGVIWNGVLQNKVNLKTKHTSKLSNCNVLKKAGDVQGI